MVNIPCLIANDTKRAFAVAALGTTTGNDERCMAHEGVHPVVPFPSRVGCAQAEGSAGWLVWTRFLLAGFLPVGGSGALRAVESSFCVVFYESSGVCAISGYSIFR